MTSRGIGGGMRLLRHAHGECARRSSPGPRLPQPGARLISDQENGAVGVQVKRTPILVEKRSRWSHEVQRERVPIVSIDRVDSKVLVNGTKILHQLEGRGAVRRSLWSKLL